MPGEKNRSFSSKEELNVNPFSQRNKKLSTLYSEWNYGKESAREGREED